MYISHKIKISIIVYLLFFIGALGVITYIIYEPSKDIKPLTQDSSSSQEEQELPLADQINASLAIEDNESSDKTKDTEATEAEDSLLTEKTDFTRKIITLKAGISKADAQQVVSSVGGTIVGNASNNIVVKLPEDNLKEAEELLASSSAIDQVETDYAVKFSANIDWGVERVQAAEAWDTVTGDGIKVAVLDTGLDTDNSEFIGNIAGGYDFVNNDANPEDDHGHGTAVSGVIAAAQNDTGTIGVSKKADLLAVKVLDGDGIGYISTLVSGIDWAVENGAQVINMSLGTTYNSSTLKNTVDKAAASGVTVIAAAGNNSGGPLLYPAAYDSVIAVGATDDNDSLASFSALGSELVAPGVSITTPWLDGRYVAFSGTSAAAPHVSGLASLLIAHGVSDVRQALQKGTTDLGDEGYDSYYGYGLPDAPQVLSLAEEDNEAPQVKFITPRNDQELSGQKVVHVEATDNREVLKVDLLISGERISSSATAPYKWEWDIANVEPGTYVLMARAFDAAGNITEKTIEVKVVAQASQPQEKNPASDNQRQNTFNESSRSDVKPTPTPRRTSTPTQRNATVPTPTITAPPQSSVKKIEPTSIKRVPSPQPTVIRNRKDDGNTAGNGRRN